ncbi:T9SS type A sorting domain-containing protein [bacterium]|nr:T9SS type A sorting domain-containing protein [bacterium]
MILVYRIQHFILLCHFGFLIGISFAQGPDTLWTRVIGGEYDDHAYDIRQTADGGYIVAGYTSIPTGTAALLIRLDSLGDTVWTRSYREEGAAMAMCVYEMPDGGFILSGVGYNEHGTWDVMGARTDASGNIMWLTTVEGYSHWGYSTYPTVDGGSVVASGYGISQVPDIRLIKFDADGDTVWTRYYGGPSTDIVREVQQTTDRGYILAGSIRNDFVTGLDLYLVRTDENGDTLWTRTYGGIEYEWGYSMDQCLDGGFVITGQLEHSTGPLDLIIVKTDSLGYLEWTKIYDDPFVYGSSIEQTVDSGFVICGYASTSEPGGGDVFLLKLDANGDSLWARIYGGIDADVGRAVRQTTDQGYVIAGHTQSFGYPDYNVYVVKTGPDVTAAGISHPLPITIVLHQNYPNPFNASTRITFDLPKAGLVILKVYDVLGRKVGTLMNGVQEAGCHSVLFDGSDLSSGIYFYRLEMGDLHDVKKMVMLK